MAKARVEFELDIPVEATKEEVEEWIRFNLHTNSMRLDNPLSDHEMEASWITVRVL